MKKITEVIQDRIEKDQESITLYRFMDVMYKTIWSYYTRINGDGGLRQRYPNCWYWEDLSAKLLDLVHYTDQLGGGILEDYDEILEDENVSLE